MSQSEQEGCTGSSLDVAASRVSSTGEEESLLLGRGTSRGNRETEEAYGQHRSPDDECQRKGMLGRVSGVFFIRRHLKMISEAKDSEEQGWELDAARTGARGSLPD